MANPMAIQMKRTNLHAHTRMTRRTQQQGHAHGVFGGNIGSEHGVANHRGQRLSAVGKRHGLLSRESRGAFLQKCTHAFDVIMGPAHRRLGVSLHIKLLVQAARSSFTQQ